MVTEFSLTNESVQPVITSSAFFQLSRTLDPTLGLLPSLSRLRIIDADIYIAYLHLLYTPSLKTLEATNIPDHQHSNFFSFLTTLLYKAPLLEHIILGPGQFPLKSLQAILEFTYLRELELRDVASTFDFTFIQDVGALPNLEFFMLDARSCKYIVAEAGSQSLRSSTIMGYLGASALVAAQYMKKMLKAESPKPRYAPTALAYPEKSKTASYQTTGDVNSSTSTTGGFHRLKKFDFTGGLPLIHNIIPYIASNTLEDISITIIRLLHRELEQIIEEENKNATQAKAEERKRKAEEEKQRRIAVMESEMNGRYLDRTIKSRREKILRKAEDQWKSQEAQIEKRLKAERVQRAQETFDLHTALYVNVLQTVSSRWSENLKSVKLNQSGWFFQQSLIPPVLPKQVYGTLFRHPKIETLDFKGWKLGSIEDVIFSLKSSSPKNLKQLHLPIDDPDCRGVSLSDLLDIAKACPMLKSLQCYIDTLPPIPQYSIPTSEALSHGLQKLYVANDPTSLWDFNQLLLVARHLYLMFPRLETIDNVDGPNAEQWVRVRDLFKVFQAVRKDNMYRL